MLTILSFIKKHLVLSVIGSIVIVVVVASTIFFSTRSTQQYQFTTVERGSIAEEVSVTGKVVPVDDINLAFEQNGKIGKIYLHVGDHVKKGEALIGLDGLSALANLAEAAANLKTQQAKLDELKAGTRSAEITLKEVAEQNAEASVGDSEKNIIATIKDAFTKSDDAIHNKVDQFISNPKSSSPQFNFNPADSQLAVDVIGRRVQIESDLTIWMNMILALNNDVYTDSQATIAKSTLNEINIFLDKIAIIVNSLTPTSTLSQTTISGYKTDVASARTNVNTALLNVSASEEKLQNARATLSVAKNNLILAQAGATPQEVAVQEAQVEQAQASLDSAQINLSKTVLRSPINGVITMGDLKVGELVTAQSPVVSVISDKNYQIETQVPEVDIAKIKIADIARVTLDAYGTDVDFPAHVVLINPAEKIVEGVATYKVTLEFDQTDIRIKSGMTANIDITTQKKVEVLIVPQRAVTTKDGQSFVSLRADGQNSVREQVVVTGLRGSDGNIEVISGLKEGDSIVRFGVPSK